MTHAAEHLGEEVFLRECSGAFAEVYRRLGRSLGDVPRFSGSPIAMLESVGMLEAGVVLAHVNYPSHDDLDLLARRGASVVYCPRTHEYFGHRFSEQAPHPIEQMMEMGVDVSLGTDSRASSPDLDVLAEARCVRRKFPSIEAGRLLRAITLSPANALGLGEVIGTLSPGKRADVCAVGIGASRGWETVLDDVSGERAVWIEGERV
jgi:cytosine/adenosine deaminase-related metal-dependent hydrolase